MISDLRNSLPEYVADSFGEHSYIDRSEARSCSAHCPCQRLNGQIGSDFAFIVRKTASSIHVEFQSTVLQSRVSELLGQAPPNPPSNTVNGFELLQNSGLLETHLRLLRTGTQGHDPIGFVAEPSYEQRSILEAELAVLVEGVLGDYHVFESFGYENLHEIGCLSYDHWIAWTNSKILEAEDYLDREFHTTGQFEGVDNFDTFADDDLAEQPLTDPSALSEPPRKAPLVQPEDQNILSLRLAASRFSVELFRDQLGQLFVIGTEVPHIDDRIQKEVRIRCLHREFQKEHAHILSCAQSSTAGKLLEPLGLVNPRPWGSYGFDRNYSFAWRRGMATMRALHRGEGISGLNSAIWFLTIAKIILATDSSDSTDRQKQFLSDLNRYQGLFSPWDGSLDAFRSAVQDIWGFSLNNPPHHDNTDLTTLKYFQELAGSLLQGSESPLRHREDSDYGLLTSQRRWRMHHPAKSGTTDGGPDPFHEPIPENLVKRGSSAWHEHGSHSSFQDTANSQPYVSAHHAVLLTIMAGFIFGVVLAFLLSKISIISWLVHHAGHD